MNIDTVTLQIFLAIADTGSFTKAAERVGRTQSAVSQQISKLEHLLGKSLFDRQKNYALTQEGELFLSYAQQIYALQREAFDRFKEPELEGEVRFGLPEDFASLYLSDVLVDFSRAHPRIFLNVECDLTLNLYERFQRSEFDLILLKSYQLDSFPNATHVCTEKLEWVGHSQILHSDSQKPIPLILSPRPCVYRARALQALDQQGLKWRVIFSSPSYAGTIAAVKAGLGITVLPHLMVPADLEILDSENLPSLHDTHLVLLKNDSHHPALNSFEAHVLAKISR